MKYPNSKLPWILIGWSACGAVMHAMIVISRSRQANSIEGAVGNFFTDLLMPYLYGAFASQLLFVWALAVACIVVYALLINSPFPLSVAISRISLGVILLLSLFTLWIEPFTTTLGRTIALDTAAQLAKVPLKAVDLGVSVTWIFLFLKASRDIGKDAVAYRKKMLETIPSGTFKCPACESVDLVRCEGVHGKLSRLVLYFLWALPLFVIVGILASGGSKDPGMTAGHFVLAGLIYMLPGVAFLLIARRPLLRCEGCSRQALARDIRVSGLSSKSRSCVACGGLENAHCKGIYGKWNRFALYVLLTWPWLFIGVNLVAGKQVERGAEWAVLVGGIFLMLPGAVFWLVKRRPYIRCSDCGRRSLAENLARH